MKSSIRHCLAGLAMLTASPSLQADTPLLTAGVPIPVPDSTGGFDFIKIDAVRNRLLANHTSNGTLDVFDLADGKLLKHVATGKCQDVAVDAEAGTYLVSVSKEQKIAVVDATRLEVVREIKLEGPADAIVLDPSRHELYVGHDDEKNLWIVDTQVNKVSGTIAITGAPEVAVLDAASNRVFQNIKTDSTVVAIDTASHAIKGIWSTAPATGPHGLAYNPVTHHLFCAGANEKLAAIDAVSGKSVGSADIAKGVDQIVFDEDNQCVYCACGSGKISILHDSTEGITLLGSIESPSSARSIAYDAKGHALWIAYGDAKGSSIQRFAIGK